MADVAENATYPDAATAISQGKRHLLVRDYTAAVTAFAEGLEMLSQKLSDCDDELGEPYLLYGRALLGLAREEAGVLGGGVPGSDDTEEDEDADEEDGDEDKLSDVDEKDESMEDDESAVKKESEESTEKTDDKTTVAESTKDVKDKGNEKKDKEQGETGKDEKNKEKDSDDAKEKEPEKKENDENGKVEKPTATTNKTDDKKIEEQKLEKGADKASEKGTKDVAGTSKEVHTNGTVADEEKSCNGKPGKSEDADDDDDVNKEDDEEDPGRGIDLQVAWEVLELAKIVFVKRGEAGLKQLAETHRLLGEVAMESGNHEVAIMDLGGALNLLQKIEPCEPRAIAELHYQLGLAHSLANAFDASIEQFNKATTLLEARIKDLEDLEEPPKSDDPFYSVEGEIKELKELLPEIQEKITDMKDFKQEACRLVIEGIKNKEVGSCTNGAGSSSDGASSSSHNVSPKASKPASDISHLVRKKRKADEPEAQVQSPCKKPTP